MHILVRLALRSLVRNPRRTLVALGTVAIGVAALIVAGGFVNALLVKLREDTIYSQLGHIQIQHARYADVGLSRPYSYLLPADGQSLSKIEALPGVKTATPRLDVSGLISVGESTLSFSGQGVDPAKEEVLARGLAIAAGSPLRRDDRNAVILGEGLAANLGVKVGEKVTLLVTAANGTFNAADVVVRGTFSSVSKAYDDIGLRLPLPTAEQLLRVKGAQRWLVVLEDTDSSPAFVERIRHALKGQPLALTQWDQDADFYRKTSELFARQFGFVRIIVMIIIVLSILNTMTMSVLERTSEIGVMLALGDSRRQILGLFACEGALLGVVGGLCGVALGILMGIVANIVGIPMPPPPGMSHGFEVGIVLSGGLVAVSIIIGVVAAFVASLPPAIRASRLVVVDALRTSQ